MEPNGKPRAGCKSCLRAATKIQQKGYYKRNPEGCKAKVRRWQQRNPDRVRKYARDGIRRLRRRRRDAGQTFLPLAPASNSNQFASAPRTAVTLASDSPADGTKHASVTAGAVPARLRAARMATRSEAHSK